MQGSIPCRAIIFIEVAINIEVGVKLRCSLGNWASLMLRMYSVPIIAAKRHLPQLPPVERALRFGNGQYLTIAAGGLFIAVPR